MELIVTGPSRARGLLLVVLRLVILRLVILRLVRNRRTLGRRSARGGRSGNRRLGSVNRRWLGGALARRRRRGALRGGRGLLVVATDRDQRGDRQQCKQLFHGGTSLESAARGGFIPRAPAFGSRHASRDTKPRKLFPDFSDFFPPLPTSERDTITPGNTLPVVNLNADRRTTVS